MGKRFLATVAALGAIFLGMVALIWIATSDEPSASPAPPQASAAIEPVGLVSVAGVELASPPLGGLPGQEYVIVKDAPAAPPPPGSWEAVPILAARRGTISLDLEEVQPRLTDCFSPSVSSRSGNVLEVKDAAPLQDDSTTTLLLELEVTGDRARIVDAPVESRGQATTGTLSCAQAVLRGQDVPSPGLAPGKYRLRLVLAP